MSVRLRLRLYSFCFITEKKEPECDEMKLLYGMFLITCLFVFVFHFELFGSFAWHEISVISGEFGYCPFHQLDFELILSNRLIEKLFRVYIASSKQERGGPETRELYPLQSQSPKMWIYCIVTAQ